MAFAAGLAFYLDAATVISVAIALPVWRSHFGLALWQVGLLTAGLAFAIALGSLAGGWLGDRFGRSRVFTLDLMIFVLGTVLIITAAGPTMLIIGVIVVGLAAGADMPTALAVISDEAPDWARGRLIGLTQVLWIAAILATYGLGFAVSTSGFRGTQILIGHLVLLAIATLALRLVLTTGSRRVPGQAAGQRLTVTPRILFGAGVALPLLATGLFLLFWNIASTTLGTYGTYVLVTVTQLTQTQATGLVLVTFPPALLMSVLFVRLADTVWRDRLFVVAMILQIAAFAIGALTGGTLVAGMIALTVLYSLSNVFAGEAAYKVWSQLLFPADVRATALGVTYGVARGAAAAFMFVDTDPAGSRRRRRDVDPDRLRDGVRDPRSDHHPAPEPAPAAAAEHGRSGRDAGRCSPAAAVLLPGQSSRQQLGQVVHRADVRGVTVALADHRAPVGDDRDGVGIQQTQLPGDPTLAQPAALEGGRTDRAETPAVGLDRAHRLQQVRAGRRRDDVSGVQRGHEPDLLTDRPRHGALVGVGRHGLVVSDRAQHRGHGPSRAARDLLAQRPYGVTVGALQSRP